MSFHGGVIGVSLAIILMARRHKLDWLRIHDYVACVVPIGLGLGRLANFVNGELWGRPTDASWGVIFPGAPGDLPRHPSQLYEFRSEEHTSELQSLMRISYAVFCLKKKIKQQKTQS